MRRERRGEYRAALRTLQRFAAPHQRFLALGWAAAFGLAACRLAIPWPLRWSLDALRGEDAFLSAQEIADPILLLAGAYLVVAIAYGLCDLAGRAQFGRFASLVVEDLRAEALQGAMRSGVSGPDQLGDVTSRLLGDSARLRSDLNGILVHVSMNALVFLAVSALMLVVSTPLGLVFFGSGALAVAIGAATSPALAAIAHKQRTKEGQYAGAVHAELAAGAGGGDALAALSSASGSKEMRTTRVLASASLAAHTILAAGVGIGIWLGSGSIRAGTMDPGDLFLFIAYALTVQRRLVQVGRQVARTGKAVATLNRLASLVDPGETAHEGKATPLRAELRIEGARARGQRGGRRSKLRRTRLELAPGSRVAVLGPVGSGKTSLLRILAGREPGCEGEIHWGSEPLGTDARALADRVGYVGERVVFPRRALWEIAGLPADAPPTDHVQQVLEGVGASKVAKAFDEGWQSRVASAELSGREARNLALARLVLSDDSPVWILDGVLDDRSRKKARRCLDEILRRAGERAVVVAMSRPVDLHRFDRVIELRRGRIAFDGPPSARGRHAA